MKVAEVPARSRLGHRRNRRPGALQSATRLPPRPCRSVRRDAAFQPARRVCLLSDRPMFHPVRQPLPLARVLPVALRKYVLAGRFHVSMGAGSALEATPLEAFEFFVIGTLWARRD